MIEGVGAGVKGAGFGSGAGPGAGAGAEGLEEEGVVKSGGRVRMDLDLVGMRSVREL